jgi:methyl-accepting chemotaxis protein
MFKNMKVKVQLGVGFGIALLLMISISVMGIWGMKASNDQLNDIVKDNMVKIELVTTMSESVHIVSRVLRSMVMLDDVSAIKEEEQKLLAAREAYNKAWDALEKTSASERGQAIRTKIREAASAARTLNNAVIELALNNKDDEARDMMLKTAGPAVKKWQDALDENAALQKENSAKQAAEAEAAYSRASTIMITLSIIGVLLSLVIAFMITRNLMQQLGGEPAYAAEVVTKIAAGDMTVDVHTLAGDRSSMLAAIKNMVEKLSQIVGEVNAAATNIASASEEVSSTAQSMAQATNEQAASVEETSASVEQMGASINQNSENAKVTDGMATQAAKQATQGGEAVKETVIAMKSIAGKIGIIDDIAYQTNLLALNAAIEAARAGEHGKGFAVVAAEVRKLAERSQVAAQEIGELASGSVSKAEDAGKLLDEIVPAITKTSDLVQEITAASEEQSSGAAQINTAMNQLNTITQQNASSTEELAATAEEMSSQAEQLQQLMSFFQVSGGSASTMKHQAFQPSASKAVAKPAKSSATKLASRASHDESEFVRF